MSSSIVFRCATVAKNRLGWNVYLLSPWIYWSFLETTDWQLISSRLMDKSEMIFYQNHLAEFAFSPQVTSINGTLLSMCYDWASRAVYWAARAGGRHAVYSRQLTSGAPRPRRRVLDAARPAAPLLCHPSR